MELKTPEVDQERKDDLAKDAEDDVRIFCWEPPIGGQKELAGLSTRVGTGNDCRECGEVQLSDCGKGPSAVSDETHEGCGKNEKKWSSTKGSRWRLEPLQMRVVVEEEK